MKGLAKYVLIAASCLSAASSRSSSTPVEASATTPSRGALSFELVERARLAWPAFARANQQPTALPEVDTWPMVILGAGLVALQLRRKQKSLQAARMSA